MPVDVFGEVRQDRGDVTAGKRVIGPADEIDIGLWHAWAPLELADRLSMRALTADHGVRCPLS
jgi:hypothetical protein